MSAQPKWTDDLCRRDGMLLVPYVEMNGAWTITDRQVIAAYDGLVADGTLETVFPQANPMAPDDLLTLAKAPGILMTFVYVEDQLAGFAWLSDLRRKWALGNFALFKAIWGSRTHDVGRMVLNLWFHMEHHGEAVFETIGGLTPSENRLALKFVRSLGFTLLGNIPIGPSSVTISYLTRGQFYGWR